MKMILKDNPLDSFDHKESLMIKESTNPQATSKYAHYDERLYVNERGFYLDISDKYGNEENIPLTFEKAKECYQDPAKVNTILPMKRVHLRK